MSTANASSSLFPPDILESFSALRHEARLQAFSSLLDHCSHHDHVALQEELEARLARDFMTLLPPEIAIMILSYLPLKGLLAGRHVCRGWREVISGATPLWRNAANDIGLSGAIVKIYLPECDSYMELTLMALRHRKCLSSYVPELVRAEKLGDRRACLEEGGCCLLYEDIESGTMRDIKRVCNDGSLVTLHTSYIIDGPRHSRPKIGPFAPISNRDFVFWGEEDVGWIGWSATTPPSPQLRTEAVSDLARVDTDSKLHVWRTNELQICDDDFIGVCRNCGLIAIPYMSHHGVASVIVRKLTPGKSTVNEVRKCCIKLPESVTPDPDSGYACMYVFPKECVRGVCGSHYLLVQWGNERVFSLHSVPADFSCMESELPTIIRLPKELGPGESCEAVVHVCPSTDGSVVAFYMNKHEEQYHLWEPESGRVVVVYPPSLCQPPYVLATGNMYSILGGGNEIVVTATYTGQILLRCIKSDMISLGPAEQSWLSSFDSPENLSISTQYEYRREHPDACIATLIARRSV